MQHSRCASGGRLRRAIVVLTLSVPALPAAAMAGTPEASPALMPRPGMRPEGVSAFDLSLRSRLEVEARRQRLGSLLPPSSSPLDDGEDGAETGRRVEKAVLRALRGALDDRITTAARSSATFAGLFRFIDTWDGAAPEARAGTTGAVGGVAADAGAEPARAGASRLEDLSFRIRLDAHPRVLMGARLGRLSGRLEVPLLEREVRMSLDHPIGLHGRGALRAGVSAERGDWADLSLAFRF